MPRVIRYGQKPNKGTSRRQWSDTEILQAFWDMEEAKTGRLSPMKRREQELKIPELNPVPEVPKKVNQYG